MKKFIFYAALLCATIASAQGRKIAQHVATLNKEQAQFRKVQPLTATMQRNADADKVAGEATYARLSLAEVADIASKKYEFIELSIPYNGASVTMQLYRVALLAEGFHVDTDKASAVPFEQGAYYRGIIKGEPNSVAAFSFFNNEMNGIVSSLEHGNLVAGKLQQEGNTTDYIIYSDAKMKVPHTFHCDVDEERLAEKLHRDTENTARGVESNKCVTVYFEIDYNLYQQNSSSTTATTNWMTSVFNNVQTLYENDGITTALKSVYIWTTDDPYEGTSSADYLMQFNQVRPVFDGDVGQLVGIDPGGLGGVATTIAGVCSEDNFSYSDVNFSYATVPTFSWTVQVITHELGHLLGSPHTHGCYWNGNNTSIDGCGTTAGYVEGNCAIGEIPDQGTIMSYCHLIQGVGINFLYGFGPQPATRILNHVNSRSCLSTDCINTCINTVSAYSIIDTQLNSVTIQWTDAVSSGPWQVAFGPVNSTLTNYQTVSSNTFTATGLNPNTYYKFSVRPICPTGLTPASNDFIFASGADYCSGITFTDTGGVNGAYPNNQRLVRTFRPQNPAQHIIVSFTSFNTEADYDFMYVYDGPDTNSFLLGEYSGTFSPGVVESSSPDGALTFEFVSDQYLTAPGWVAQVTCSALSMDDSVFEGFTYYPNPSTGWVSLRANEALESVSVYNVAGQLLLQSKLNAASGRVDISTLSDGVYFFKVSGSGKETNFRIIKQN